MLVDDDDVQGQHSLSPRKPQCQRTRADIEQMMKGAPADKLRLVPEIFLCAQYLGKEREVHETMVHELIHAIDFCRSNMDPANNCVHLACTEVRAANLSGECNFYKELPRILTKDSSTTGGKYFAGHGQDCVRRRAILSVRANPKCTDRAETYVDATMHRCFRDYYPFPQHPNQM
jgi:mitochondrial inner membrane protease ATP23